MRKFLYITPLFPPTAHVGALRPLKFLRHLEKIGWSAVLLSDLNAKNAIAHRLADEIPPSAIVVRDYARRSRINESKMLNERRSTSNRSRQSELLQSLLNRHLPRTLRDALNWRPSPELVPLGLHVFDVHHACRAAIRVLAEHPNCEAIVVNSDPHATLLVGVYVRAKTNLPLVLDLRDPWSVCELRRPMRWAPQRWLVDWLERKAVTAASKVILNTETALNDYRRHYDMIEPDRFCCIRNHSDADLISSGDRVHFDRFTMLFLGRLRRHVEGDVLVHILAELRRRSLTSKQMRLVFASWLPDRFWRLAKDASVDDFICEYGSIPYSYIGNLMDAADLLISLSNATQQRIPAKIFDYVTTRRPIVNISDNRELAELMATISGSETIGLNDVPAIADCIERIYKKGRRQNVVRSNASFNSQKASAKLAGILDHVTCKPL